MATTTQSNCSGSMQCVWKEDACELSPLCNMWLLGAQAMFESARKFGEGGIEVEGERQLMSFILKMSS